MAAGSKAARIRYPIVAPDLPTYGPSTMTFIPLNQIKSFTAPQRLPPWFKVKATTGKDYLDIKQTIERLTLHTICEEARCPNRWECWNSRTATFLILGEICTRRCHYCSVETGRPLAVDHEEPRRVAEAVAALERFSAALSALSKASSQCSISRAASARASAKGLALSGEILR